MNTPFDPETPRRPGIFSRLRASFLTGIVVIAPVGLTIWLIWTVIGWVDGFVWPLVPSAWQPDAVVNYLLNNKYSQWSFDKYFICGPGEMIDEVAQTLSDRGINQDAILFERFTTSDDGEEVTVAEGQVAITIIVDDDSDELSCKSGTTILQAAIDEGIDVPYSCQGGICSSCIAKVTEGKAEMQKNQILTDSEGEDGLVLTCQAIPVTAKLVLDYDDV